ncbi:uncharacterized protein LOC119694654 [Plutella xylostella]|uniref:uncharacterized protein LOC125489144 n=1 Tax=Plutella xylostella TaxID=51655 RepID=UPI002032CE07|nr:uncharacterized protein LOC125489144 [Plutella xylostella]XP_048480013.1 uncharacterized protein LOC119694654 [Plutella xylostella]
MSSSPDILTDSSQETRKRPRDDEQSSTPKGKRVIVDPDLASASIQTIFTHPSLDATKVYDDSDPGPFIVHVTQESSSGSTAPAASSPLRAIKFGQFLYKNKISDITRDGVKMTGRNRVTVEFRSAKAANEFIKHPALTTNKFKAVIPTYHITRMGVARRVPLDLSMDEFVGSLDLPAGCGIVLKARRISRKVVNNGNTSYVPTQTIVITFRGQLLPEKIFSYRAAVEIERYTYPTIQCHACCRFGHMKASCRSKPRCYKCAQPHLGETCDADPPTCIYCSGSHASTSKNCPEQARQKSIKVIMSQDSISFAEADARLPKSRKSFAEVTASQPIGPPANKSYKKTVYTQRRPRSPLSPGYDRLAHQALISSPSSSLPNGSALNSITSITPNDNLLDNLLSLVVSLLAKFSDTIPPHVALKLKELTSFTQNGSEPDPGPPVECSEP